MPVTGEPEPKQQEAKVQPVGVEKGAVLPLKEMRPTTTTVVEPPSEPTIAGESPGIKRRQSRVESSTATTTQVLPTKRVKAADNEVKVLPVRYEFCPVEDMVVLIASMISELVLTNDNLPPKAGALTRFHSR